MHGMGRFTWKSGKAYDGMYYEGKKNGFGTMIFENGWKYDGSWKDGLQDGMGKVFDENGVLVKECYFQAGVLCFSDGSASKKQ